MEKKEISIMDMLKHFNNTFFLNTRKERVSTIDASDFEDLDNFSFKYFKGIHTIRNINEETSDDLFYIRGENTIPGYFESEGAKFLNLIDGKKKIVRSICNSYYHAVIDDISDILYTMDQFPDHQLILDISDIKNQIKSHVNFWDFFYHFIKLLEKKKVKYKLVSLKEYDIIYIDNFRLASFVYETGRKVDLVHKFFKESIKDKNITPYRNVYLSRNMREKQSSEKEIVAAKNLSLNKDFRIDDHEATEEYFKSLGYEVINSEIFPSFEAQINYFYSVKKLVSLTGSGLSNAAFMQPGGIVIEIVSPILTTVPPPNRPKNIEKPFWVNEVHNFYKMIAFYMNHIYVGIQNSKLSFEELKNTIENSKELKDLLKNE